MQLIGIIFITLFCIVLITNTVLELYMDNKERKQKNKR